MKETKATQGEGYDFYDLRQLAFPAAGPIEAPYMVGVNQNVQIEGAWPSQTGVFPTALTADVAPPAVNVPVADITVFAALAPVLIIDANASQGNIIVAIIPGVVAPAGVLVMAVPMLFAFTVAANAVVVGASHAPVDAQNTLLISTQPCFIRLVNTALIAQQAIGIIAAGLPVQIPIQADIWYAPPDKWIIMHVVGQGVAPGVLMIKASG